MHIETEAKFSGEVFIPADIKALIDIAPGQTVKIIIEEKKLEKEFENKNQNEIDAKIEFLKSFATDSDIKTTNNLICRKDAFRG